MKSLKVLLVMLVLAVALAACRSIPNEVIVGHNMSMVASNEAFGIAESTLTKIEEKSTELNDDTVLAAFTAWTQQMMIVMESRSVVQKYLIGTKAGDDVRSPYAIGNMLLIDMHAGFNTMNVNWQAMITTRVVAAEHLIELFRKDMERFRVLERKFDEWITQFRVKG